MRVDIEDVHAYMTDGRRISFLVERRLRRELQWDLAASEGAAYDLVDRYGAKWEVRSLSRGGVYFTPSNQVGSGRSFDRDALLSKLESIQGFMISDIASFPEVPVYSVDSQVVLEWYLAGRLGSNAKVSRHKFLNDLLVN